MSDLKEQRKLFKQLKKQGWTVTKARKNQHFKLVPPSKILASHPDAPPHVIFAQSASDWRSKKNTLALLKREYGVSV